jgi:hypothetical protein
VVAGEPQVDYPGSMTALSVVPLGGSQALTSRVRRETENHLYISPPRTATGLPVRFVDRDQLELSWQADDGLRKVSAVALALVDDYTWRVRIAGPASRIQRRTAVRAPIGLSVWVAWDTTELTGSTLDLSEGGMQCVFRPKSQLGLQVPFPKKSQTLTCRLDLHSEQLVAEVSLVRRRPRPDRLHEWSLRFHQLPDPAADLIRSHVFTALRNARARGLVSLY